MELAETKCGSQSALFLSSPTNSDCEAYTDAIGLASRGASRLFSDPKQRVEGAHADPLPVALHGPAAKPTEEALLRRFVCALRRALARGRGCCVTGARPAAHCATPAG